MLSEKQKSFIYAPFVNCLDVAEGTPRSGKTHAATRRFALHLRGCRDQNHLIAAYNQEQAYRLIIDGDGHGLMHYFKGSKIRHDDGGVYLDVRTYYGPKKVYFKGGGKADSLKSITGMSFGSVYFCEINLLHMDMIQECFRRTMAARDRWHIADLNPPAPSHPVISEVFDIQDTRWAHWTIDDNPIITPQRKKELHDTLIKNKFLYERDWKGNRCIPQGVIYSMFNPKRHIIEKMPDEARPIEMVFFGDGGLTDATSISCNIICGLGNGYKMYRVANWYYDGGNKAMSTQAREIAQEFAPYCRNKYHMREDMWYIDPACKALRKELELFDIDTTGADNNAHDVQGSKKGISVGIEYCQNLLDKDMVQLVEDNRFGHANFEKEVGMYCVDDHGVPVDAYNHCMDEFRYSGNYFAKNYVY